MKLLTGNKDEIENAKVQRKRSIAYFSGSDLGFQEPGDARNGQPRSPEPINHPPTFNRKDSRIAYRIAEHYEKEKADARMGVIDERVVLNDMQKLSRRLAQLKLKMITMNDDGMCNSYLRSHWSLLYSDFPLLTLPYGTGNCQFRSLSYELYNSQQHYKLVRRKCVEYIKENKKKFKVYFDGASELNHYIRTMAKDKTWGDELTLRACCDCYGLDIHVIQVCVFFAYCVRCVADISSTLDAEYSRQLASAVRAGEEADQEETVCRISSTSSLQRTKADVVLRTSSSSKSSLHEVLANFILEARFDMLTGIHTGGNSFWLCNIYHVYVF